MNRGAPNPTAPEQIADRLRITREALGHNLAVMGGMIGSSAQTWQNYEASYRRISLDQALKLCAAIGASLDWIYRGNIQSLPTDLAEKIQVQLRIESGRSKSRAP